MKRVNSVRCGCVVAAAMATVGQVEALAGGAFTENTNYATPGRAPGSPTDKDHAPYGWIGYNGAQTWEIYRKYEPDSYQDPGGVVANDQTGVTITNDPMAPSAHAIAHNETSNFAATPDMSAGGAWNGPGILAGPLGQNAFPTSNQLLVANPVSAGAPQNMEIRMGFVTTADLKNFIYNSGDMVGAASDGGDGRSAVQNGGTRRTSHSDFYAGFSPSTGADTYYLHVALDPMGTISGTNAYARSGDNPNNESGATAIVINNPDGSTSTVVKESGNVGPGPYAVSAKLIQNAASPTGWSFEEHIGGYTATYDLPDLKMDPSGVAFHSGTFDPTKVTPVIYAQDASGGGDYADADLFSTVPGDANLDGKVNFADLLILAQNYGKTDVGWIGGDFAGTGKVDFGDLLILAQHYGAGPTPGAAPVPEPATGMVVGLAAVALLARRRRGW